MERFDLSQCLELKIIGTVAFSGVIEKIEIPSSVDKICFAWSSGITNLKAITVNPENKFYKSYEDKLILRKSCPEKSNFDAVFSSINSQTILIPRFVEIIDNHAFFNLHINKIEFESDSKVRVFNDRAF